MKTYVINLERSVERRKHIIKEIEKHNLNYELVKAVEGAALPRDEFERLCNMDVVRQNPKWLNPGMIGCSLSHLSVYRKICESDETAALVLEDDVILPDDFGEFLSSVKKYLKQNEVILLHYMSFETLKLSKQQSDSVNKNYQILSPCSLRGVNSGAAYIITRSAAQHLAENLLPIDTGPDAWSDFIAKGKLKTVRCVYPMNVNVVGAKSTISATGQSNFRARLTELIDDYKISPFYQILRRMRLKSIQSRSRVRLVNEQSPYQIDNSPNLPS